jgi:glucose/mannose-6-phosphate isomerase
MMNRLIEEFPNQLKDSTSVFTRCELKTEQSDVKNILVCGLGGSGFIGDLVLDLVSRDLSIPLITNKGYHLPQFTDKSTLIIMASYSGYTEEVLNCFEEAIARNLNPICISSGGKLKELAAANGCDFIDIPTGFPPRTSLAYGFSSFIHVLTHFKIIPPSYASLSQNLGEFLSTYQPEIKDSAALCAAACKNKIIVAYTEDRIESVALRLKQQINENSKSYCWFNILPELNHNELVGWKQSHHAIQSLFLRTSFENDRNKHRFEFIKPIVNEFADSVIEIFPQGNTLAEQYFYLLHWSDWLSYFLALEQEQDPVEVNVIENLKSFLKNIN